MLIQIANLICIMFEEYCSWGLLIFNIVCGFFIEGGNYITALLNLELTTLIFCIALLKKQSNRGKILIILLFTLTGLLINCLAPGNAVRQAEFSKQTAIKAIVYSYYIAGRYMLKWSTLELLSGLVVLFLPLFMISFKKPIKLKWIPFIIFIGYSLYASTFTPTLYATRGLGADRVQNVRFFVLIIFYVMLLMIVADLLKRILCNKNEEVQMFFSNFS